MRIAAMVWSDLRSRVCAKNGFKRAEVHSAAAPSLGFDQSTTQSGCTTWYPNGHIQVTLSRVMLMSPAVTCDPDSAGREIIHDTLAHELAHAMLPPGTGHTLAWRAMDSRLGGSGNIREGEHVFRYTSPNYWLRCPRASHEGGHYIEKYWKRTKPMGRRCPMCELELELVPGRRHTARNARRFNLED